MKLWSSEHDKKSRDLWTLDELIEILESKRKSFGGDAVVEVQADQFYNSSWGWLEIHTDGE